MYLMFIILATVSGQELENIVRLIGGISWGRVEIYHNQIWGTVCSDTWSNNEARVVCRMLGYRQGNSTVTTFGNEDSQRSWLSDVECSGNEYSLHHCRHSGYGVQNCSLSENVGVRCYNDDYVKSHLQTRLSLGPTLYEGHVEVEISGMWGGICDSNWNDINAQVVCKSLGIDTYYARAVPLSGYAADKVVFPVWLNNVICNGSESNIGLCQYELWDQTSCSPNRTAGVICYKTVQNYLRLVGGNSSREGRVELYYRGQWGAFCGRWDDKHAQVVCRTLGFRGGVGLKVNSRRDSVYGNGNGQFWAQWIDCKGNESKITDCANNIKSFKDRWCANMGALSVRCVTDIRNATLRLLHGPNERQGMVEINVDGIRGTICDMHYWSFYDAMVVCKMLGFNDTVIAEPLDNMYSPWKSPPQLLKNVWCWRDLYNLQDCNYQFWKPHAYGDCRMYKNIYKGVNCVQNISDYIRLVNGSFPKEGMVQIFNKGKWGGMCSNIDAGVFGSYEAQTVCKTLGYSGGIVMETNLYDRGDWRRRTSVYTYRCGPTTRNIAECFQEGYNSFKTNACNAFQAAVRCIEDKIPKEPPVRLVYGQHNREGIVEVFYDDMWWNICDDDWNINNAKVICRSLGLRGYFAVPVPGVDFGRPDNPVLIHTLKCKGNETGLDACSYNIYRGNWRCRGTHTRAAVRCLMEGDVVLNGTASLVFSVVLNGTASVADNKTEKECSESEKQHGYIDGESDSSIILYGVTSGLVIYVVIVTVLSLVLAFLYLRRKQREKAVQQESLSEDPKSDGDGDDTTGDTENNPTAIIKDGATENKIQDNERTEL